MLDIKVAPKSSKTGIINENGCVKVYLNSPPVDGKANRECIELFAKQFRFPKSSIEIIKGSTGKNKRLQFNGLSADELSALIEKIEKKN